MNRRPLLPRQEVHRLAVIIQRHRAQDQPNHPRAVRAVNRLVEGNLRLVALKWQGFKASPAGRFTAIPSNTPDLLQEGTLGLHRAAQLYDPTRGYEFTTYAVFWIYKGFQDFARSQRRIIRLPEYAARANRLHLERTRKAVEQGRPTGAPILEEVAKALKTSPATVEMYVRQAHNTDVLSLDIPALDPSGDLGDLVGDSRRDDLELLARIDARQDFEHWANCAGLTPAERVLLLAHADGATEAELRALCPDLPKPKARAKEVRNRLRLACLSASKTPSLSVA